MDASQFKQMFLPCSGQLYRMAWRLTGNRQAAEDLVQDTFMKLWTSRNKLPQGLSPGGYALTTMRHIHYDSMRQGQIKECDKPCEEIPAVSDTDIEQQAEKADMGRRLRELIGQLPCKQRQVMMMRDVEGLDSHAIQDMTGLSEANVRTLLCRARATVRQQFKKLMNYESQPNKGICG